MTPNNETIKSLIRKLTAYFEAGDMEGWLAMCTEGLRWNMIGTPPVEGKDNVRAFMSAVNDNASGDGATPAPPKLTIHSMIVDGNKAAVTGDMDMTNEKGVPSQYSYCDIYIFEGDKISEMITYMVELKKDEVAAE